MLRPYLPDDKLFVARNTIDLAPMFEQREALQEEGKTTIRKRLSIPERSSVLVYLGRLIPEKGIGMLLEAYRTLSREGPTVLLVIGDGPGRSRMETHASSRALEDVRFLGPLSDEEAGPYLFAADVMVMPGYLGLVINHAFAFGLPVVSMRNPAGIAAHSPEVEYVESGKTGMLCDGDTVDDLVDGIRIVLRDLPRYSANALVYARSHLTLDRMVDGLYDAIRCAECD
ncbi:MAG: glycosyltransferase [Rhodothermales bacterium]